MEYKCLCCHKNCQHKFDEKWKEPFFNIYKISNHDYNKFIYFCKKVFINKNIWMTGKTSVKQYYLKKEDFHSRLNVEDLTDADYVHVRRVCKDFWNKKLRRISWFVRLKQYVTDWVFLSCHVHVSEWIYTIYLPECQGTFWSKQVRYLKFKWQQRIWTPPPPPHTHTHITT